jgi:LysM repeat protein
MNRLNKGRFSTFLALLLLLVLASTYYSSATPPDSLRTRWINGQKFLMHKVVVKDTWSGLARKYKITVADLQEANKGVPVLKLGQIIQVPASGIPAETSATTKLVKETQSVPAQAEVKKPVKTATTFKYHTVQKGETLYRISKENNITVDELKSLNNLSSNNVSVGQKLKVGNGNAEVIVPVKQNDIVVKPVEKVQQHEQKTEVKQEDKNEVKPISNVGISPAKSEPVKVLKVDTPSVYSTTGNSRSSTTENDAANGVAVDKITETGVATWITDGELNQNKFYALHRNAPIGTIIKVTNRMNNNSVFVKVVGLLPDTGDNANIIIKITQAAAQRIGAIDQRFQAELSYGVTK